MKSFSFLISPTGLTAFVNGEQYSIPTDHPNYTKIGDALRAGMTDRAVELMDVRATVKTYITLDPAFALVGDKITLNGEAFSAPVTDKVLELINAGNAPTPLFNFLRKVRQNPSAIAQNELLLFCVANGFMIDQNGDIVAYKSVRGDFTDIHSGKFSNKVGVTNRMPRHQVDDNREQTCSHGLHFASYEYASTWASQDGLHLMVLAVNPANVVSIPADYDNQKGRCSEYTVLAELPDFGQLPRKAVYGSGDFVSGPSIAQLQAEREASQEKYSKALARKYQTQDALENEIDDLQTVIADAEDVGAPTGELEAELERKENVLDKMRSDIEDLEMKLSALDCDGGCNCNC